MSSYGRSTHQTDRMNSHVLIYPGRTVNQIKTALKKKAFEDAGISKEEAAAAAEQQKKSRTSSEGATSSGIVTESEVDVEGLGAGGGENRMDFDVKL
jgi:hypothetical protein